MLSFFKKNNIEILSPCNGELIDITEVEDPVFSQKMMGDGMAIIPSDGSVYAPISGKIIMIAPTKHAICIETDQQVQLVVHFGIESVKTGGLGFEVVVKETQQVEAGVLLMNADVEYFKQQNISIVSPIVINSPNGYKIVNKTDVKQVLARQTVLFEIKKG